MLTVESSNSETSSTRRRIRVLVAAESVVTRGGISVLLGTQKDFEVVGTARNAFDVLQSAEALRPDLVILEHAILRVGGFQCGVRLRGALPNVRMIVFMDSSGPLTRDAYLAAGADSCIQKDQVPEGLVSEIHRLFPDKSIATRMRVEKEA